MAKRRALGRALTGFADAFMPAWESIERRKRLDVLDKRDEEDRALARRRTRGQDIAAAGQRIRDQWMTSEEIDALVAELEEAYPGYENFRPALEGYVPTLAQRESEFAKNENLAFMTDAQLINQAESLGISPDSTLTSAGRLPSTQYSGAGSLPPAPDRDPVNLPALTMGAPVPTMPAGWEAGVSAGDGVPAPAASAEDIAETVARLQSSPFTANDLSRIPDSQSWTVDQNPALNPFLTEARADAKRMDAARRKSELDALLVSQEAQQRQAESLEREFYSAQLKDDLTRIEAMNKVDLQHRGAVLEQEAKTGPQSLEHQRELAAIRARQTPQQAQFVQVYNSDTDEMRVEAFIFNPSTGKLEVKTLDTTFGAGDMPASRMPGSLERSLLGDLGGDGGGTASDPPPSEVDGASPPPGSPQNIDDVGKDSSQVLQDLGFTLENIDAIRTIGTGQARDVPRGRKALEKGGVENLQRAADGRNNPERFVTFVDAVSDVLGIPLEEMGKNQAFLDALEGLYDQRFGPQITKQVVTKGSSDWKKR
jgi:hypothetical protein